MPNVTIYLPADPMPSAAALAALTEDCAALCTDVLRAAAAAVHVIYVPVLHGRGHPVFAEVRYRLAAHRTPTVMARFMAGLDGAISERIGHTARIRCFAYDAARLEARN